MNERPILMCAEMVRATLEDRKTNTRRVMMPQPEHLQHYVFRGKVLYEGEHRMWCWKDLVLDNIWDFPNGDDRKELAGACPYGAPGDQLWVKESWGIGGARLVDPCLNYQADGAQRPVIRMNGEWRIGGHRPTNTDLLAPGDGWRNAMFMPRWASRITLEISEVRVQRLQEISGKDSDAEGCRVLCDPEGHPFLCISDKLRPHVFSPKKWEDWNEDDYLRFEFARLWDSINAKRGFSWEANPWAWAITFKRVQP